MAVPEPVEAEEGLHMPISPGHLQGGWTSKHLSRSFTVSMTLPAPVPHLPLGDDVVAEPRLPGSPAGTRPRHRRGHRSPSSASRGTGRADRPDLVGETREAEDRPGLRVHSHPQPPRLTPDPIRTWVSSIQAAPDLTVKRPSTRLPRPWTHCQTPVQHLSMKGWRAAEVFR